MLRLCYTARLGKSQHLFGDVLRGTMSTRCKLTLTAARGTGIPGDDLYIEDGEGRK